MPYTLTIPNEYGYVILTTVSTMFLSSWHGVFVGSYRKAAKIPYPNAYASAEKAKAEPTAYAFNCAQRAHAQFLENHGSVMTASLIAGLKYPVATSVMGVGWMVCRCLYALGYANSAVESDGKGRYRGIFYYLFQLGLYGLAGWTGWEMLSA